MEDTQKLDYFQKLKRNGEGTYGKDVFKTCMIQVLKTSLTYGVVYKAKYLFVALKKFRSEKLLSFV